jgi:hypothetical protein
MASNADGLGGGRRIPWRWMGWGMAALLLLLPLVAMQFTSEVNWTLSDFVFAGAMFGLVGGTYELAIRLSRNYAYRGGVAVALLAAFLLVWINLAVGIIGNEDNPANLIFFAVIAIALTGSIASRFDAIGMARAMTVTAVVQELIAVIVLFVGLGRTDPPGPVGLFALISFFAFLWIASAALFRKAASALGR